jgi:hypothetical protein
MLHDGNRFVRCWLWVVVLMMQPSWMSCSAAREWEFEKDIMPLLTKHGCNSGACHGAAAGRGQLHLSLFGSDPDADYEAIVFAFQGRRIQWSDPESSLVLAKPSGRLAHGGGEVFDPESSTARLLTQWIQQGATRGSRVHLSSFRVDWEQQVGTDQAEHRFRMKAWARFQTDEQAVVHSNEEVDVSDRVHWTIDPTLPMQWDAETRTAVLDAPGRYLLVARFMERVAPVVLVRPWSLPELANDTTGNWIDDQIDRQLASMRLAPAPPMTESAWMRRVCVDLTGRLPAIEHLDAYLSDRSLDRRERWVDQLLSSPEFIDYWTLRISRLLGLRGIPNEPEAAEALAAWIRDAVTNDRSYREMAYELLTSHGDSHSVGAANFSRLASDSRSHAELVARVFMGTRLQCANCHDHPLDRWKQDDYHGLAAIFAGIDRGRIVQFRSRGQVTNLKTMQPAQPRIPGVEYLTGKALNDLGVQTFAEWVVNNDNPYTDRAMVNRIWEAMMGRGLIHPVDDLRDTNPATHPELLEKLIVFYRSSGHRLRPLLREIALSQAYSRSGNASGSKADLYASGVRRMMEPEVLFDAVHDVLEVPSFHPKTGKRFQAIRLLDPSIPNESLEILGRCNRPERCSTLDSSFGLERQLHWIQGEIVQSPLMSRQTFFDQCIEQGIDDRSILSLAYKKLYARLPQDDEISLWLGDIPNTEPERRAWYQDWLASLLSSSEFLYR